MKKMILILCAATLLSFSPLMAVDPKDPGPAPDYPEYTGDINDPDVFVVYEGEGFAVINRKGKTLIYYY